jgi:hypothetical protein
VLLLISLYILYIGIKGYKALTRQPGMGTKYLFWKLRSFTSLYNEFYDKPNVQEALLDYKKEMIRLFLIWIFVLIFYALITVGIGIMTGED